MIEPEMNAQREAKHNTTELDDFFCALLKEENEEGVLGIAKFRAVYDDLIDVQKKKLRNIVEDEFDTLCKSGSIISIAIPYVGSIIDYIDNRESGAVDYNLWNRYAREYDRINQVLNRMAQAIAVRFEGIPIKATIDESDDEVNHVSEYFSTTISHRVVAENSGLGWRGKNQLVIHEKYSCAIRFASIITSMPLLHGKKMDSKCGDCSACEDACGFIKYRADLPDFRENCRRYIDHLKSKGIERDICGKCIKSCYRSSMFEKR